MSFSRTCLRDVMNNIAVWLLVIVHVQAVVAQDPSVSEKVAKHIRDLKNQDPAVRRFAAAALGESHELRR